MTRSRVLFALGALVAGSLAARPRLRSWGATEHERTRALPGDGLVPGERDVTTMATTFPAPPEAIWPWLAQMGWDRAGWYSWDRLDRGGRRSAATLHPEWAELREGDRLHSLPDQRCWFDVTDVERNRSLVLRASLDLRGRPYDPAGPRPRAFSDSRWEFFLDPQSDGTTRLLVRSGGDGGPRWLSDLLNIVFWQPAHVVMQLRQFQQLRRRVEAATDAAAASTCEMRRAPAGAMM